MALKDIGAALKDPTFQNQIAGALLTAATAVLNEAPMTGNHANRLLYANAIIGNPGAQAAFIASGILSNSTIAGEAGNAAGSSGTPFPDGDVQFVVNSFLDIYANQYAAQLNQGVPLHLGS